MILIYWLWEHERMNAREFFLGSVKQHLNSRCQHTTLSFPLEIGYPVFSLYY